MTEKPAEQGRAASMVNALKKLLTDAPLIFIVAIGILLPLSAGVGANALAFEWENTIALVLVLSGVIILVVIPLMVIYAWRENQRKFSGARQTAIESEAERRTEQERNKQKRLNEVFDAKIEVLKAEKDYILDQSERHERRLLQETSETLAKEMTKGLEFTEKAVKFDLSVTEVVAKLEATEVKFDYLLESLAKISKGLEPDGFAEPSEPEPSPKRDERDYEGELAELRKERDDRESQVDALRDIVESLKKELNDSGAAFSRPRGLESEVKPGIPKELPPPTAYDSESERMSKDKDGLSLETQLKSKQNEIKKIKGELHETQAYLAEVRDLNEQLESKNTDGSLSRIASGLIEERDELQSKYDDLLKEKQEGFVHEFVPTKLKKEDIQISSTKGEIKSEFPIESAKQELEEALKVVDNLEDDAPEISPESLLSEVEEIIKTPFPVGGYDDSQEDLAEVRPADPIPQSFWTCAKCNRANTLKRPRCMCGKSKSL